MSVKTDTPAAGPATTESASLPSRIAAAVSDMGTDIYDYGAAARGLDQDEATRTLRSGQMTSQFTMMIQVAVTLAVGVLIVGQIFDALPSTSGPLSNASDQVESLTATAFELAPVVLIVVVAALVIGVVRRI
jgi:hypothetical protein